MKYRVELSLRAQSDLEHIVTWLHSRSPEGAASWLTRWEDLLRDLSDNPTQYSLAPENEDHCVEIWHVQFKTRRGRRYRVLFTLQGDLVAITHLRDPGQDLVDPNEF